MTAAETRRDYVKLVKEFQHNLATSSDVGKIWASFYKRVIRPAGGLLLVTEDKHKFNHGRMRFSKEPKQLTAEILSLFELAENRDELAPGLQNDECYEIYTKVTECIDALTDLERAELFEPKTQFEQKAHPTILCEQVGESTEPVDLIEPVDLTKVKVKAKRHDREQLDSLAQSATEHNKTVRETQVLKKLAKLERNSGEEKERLANHLWQTLKEDHKWTHKKGSGSTSYVFLAPGVTSKRFATEGLDYFNSTEAILDFIVKSEDATMIEIYENVKRSLFEQEENIKKGLRKELEKAKNRQVKCKKRGSMEGAVPPRKKRISTVERISDSSVWPNVKGAATGKKGTPRLLSFAEYAEKIHPGISKEYVMYLTS